MNTIKDTIKDLFEKSKGFITSNFSIKPKNDKIKLVIFFIIILFIYGYIVYIRNINSPNRDQNCSILQNLYPTKPPLISVVDSPIQSVYLLRDFYIKTAYNCCCGGKYKNDFMDLCELTT